MRFPNSTTSGLYPLRLRADLPREVAFDYWAGPHATIAARLPNLVEYNQYHFSATDHGYWPATPTVGTRIPADWPTDGMTEVRLPSVAGALRIPLHMREIFLDEQNVFEHCLGHLTGPGGGRWWTTGHDDTVGHRTALLIRRRRGAPSRRFRDYLHGRLGPALHAAGARDLRTYAFLPLVMRAHTTFGVSHHNPSNRRYHGAVVFGTEARAALDTVLAAPATAAAIAEQHHTCIAIHAYTVERTVPVIRTIAAAAQPSPQLRVVDHQGDRSPVAAQTGTRGRG